MKFEEDWRDNPNCVIDTCRKVRRREYVGVISTGRYSSASANKEPRKTSIDMSGRTILRFMLLFAVAVVCGVIIYIATKGFTDVSSIGYKAALISIPLSIMVVCFTFMFVPMLKDKRKEKIFYVLGFVEAGAVLVHGILGKFDTVADWYDSFASFICCSLVVLFAACLVLILTERMSLYKLEIEAHCIGYVRMLSRYYWEDEGHYIYSCKMSPIFEYDTPNGKIKACYDEFSPLWSSSVPFDSVVKIHVNEEDMSRVQPEVWIRVLAFSLLTAVFTLIAIGSFLL